MIGLGKARSMPKPFHDRRVNVRGVACPTCGAEVGAFCRTSSGGRGDHRYRRVLALRAGLFL